VRIGNLLLTLLHLVVVVAAKLCDAGGVRAVIAENLLLKQQVIVLRRARGRAPNLTMSDRLLCGFGSLFLDAGRIRKLANALRPRPSCFGTARNKRAGRMDWTSLLIGLVAV